ncbi:MAG: DUF3078 domain-containing protein [Ignavibacteriales bacterium]|nr:DUF3078 domain-containing protein [Ignavibacteriales bacterium]
MKKIYILFVIIFYGAASAQTPDSLKNKWLPSLTTGLGISQIAFSNWVKGGENSIAWSLLGDFKLSREGDTWSFKNQIKGQFGRAKIGGDSYRTTDNDLYMENVVVYNLGWAVSPFYSNSLRTQISRGYDYKIEGSPNISDFFDPGYVTQTLGFTYDKYSHIITRFGLAFQEVFTSRFTQYTDDPATVDEAEKFKFETGIESVTDVNYTVAENIFYQNKLRLFSRFESLEVWDVRWDNTITAKVNSWLNVNFTYLVVYEKAQSPKTQMKEGLQIGIIYTLL